MAQIFAPQPTRPTKRKTHEVLLHAIEPASKKRDSTDKAIIEKSYVTPPRSIENWLGELPVDTAIRDRKFFSRSDTFLVKMSENTRQSFEMETAPIAQGMRPPPTPSPRPQSEDAMFVLQNWGGSEGLTSIETEALKNAVRQSNYRNVLTDHGVYISYYGIGAPKEVFDVAWNIISKQGSEVISDCELGKYWKILESLSNEAEPDFLQKIIGILPLPDVDIVQTSSRFDGHALPRKQAAYRIAAPFCDRTYAYNRDLFSAPQRVVSDFLWQFITPSKQGIFPFFAVEFKSPSRHGTHWVAENQCAGFGAHRLRSVNELYQKAGMPPGESTQNIMFSCTVDYTRAVFWVHWLEPDDEPKYKSRQVCTLEFARPKDLRHLKTAFMNIWEYGINERLPRMRELLDRLYPYVARQRAEQQRQPQRRQSRSRSRRPLNAGSSVSNNA